MATILVVEDDPSTNLVITVNLEKEGHRVVSFGDGAQALARIHHVQPDLLITDIQLPGLDGLALVEKLRGDPQWASLPIVVLTALSQRVNYRVGMTAGADDYLTKPFSLSELRQAVVSQLKRSSMMHEVQREAVQHIVNEEKEKLAASYEKKYHQMVSNKVDDDSDLKRLKIGIAATTLCTGIVHYLRYSEALNPEQLGNLMQRYYEGILDAMQLFGAKAVQFDGGSVLAVYPIENNKPGGITNEVKLWRAAAAVRQASQRLKTSFDRRFSQMGLPLFETSVALHIGTVQLLHVGTVGEGETYQVPIGDTVNAVREMFKKRHAQWGITASVELMQGLRQVAAVGERQTVHVPPRLNPLEVCELKDIPSLQEA